MLLHIRSVCSFVNFLLECGALFLPLDVLDPTLCLCLFPLGTERHELTSWMSFNSIFRFFNEVLELKEDDKAEGPFSAVTTRSGSLKPNHQNL